MKGNIKSRDNEKSEDGETNIVGILKKQWNKLERACMEICRRINWTDNKTETKYYKARGRPKAGGQSAGRVQVAMSTERGRSCKRHGREWTQLVVAELGPKIKPRRINAKIVRV